jgi:CRP-like cAMP-binding protein
MMKSK